jgi:hypothetical protein
LEKFFTLDEEHLLMSVSIKDVDENTYRNLRAEATRHGMRVGDAATEAFRLWVASKRQAKQRDEERMRHASEDMDNLRKTDNANWSGAEEIRKWRDERRR